MAHHDQAANGSVPTPAGQPVTVSIHRVVNPDHVPEVTRWVQSGVNLANRWDGFLGSGWIRAAEGSRDWHMLYRFADADRLAAWEQSAERRDWLAQGTGLVEELRYQQRTGIEGWFDDPARTDEPADVAAVVVPPRWKQATSIWLGFFPVNLLFTALFTYLVPSWDDVPLVLKVLISTLILTPIMAYWVLPWVTRRLHGWLHRTSPRT